MNLPHLALALILFATVPLTAVAADSRSPGWVDIDSFGLVADEDMLVDVHLGGWLMGLARAAAADSGDPDADIIQGIEQIRVRVFDTSRLGSDFVDQAQQMVASLRRDGWEEFASVRDRRESAFVHVLVLGNDQQIDGITLVAIDDQNEAVLVNIVGRIRPADVARLLNDEGLIHANLDWS